ncbi:MAG: Holliday junction resolvase RuvX, partial [Psychrobacter celer]
MVDRSFMNDNAKMRDDEGAQAPHVATDIDNNTAEPSATEPSVKPHLILALDYGVKKMGMALGNTITETARAFDILAMNNGQPDWDNLLG